MDSNDIKYIVAGPYQPIDPAGGDVPNVVTAETVVEIVEIYYSILMWRGHSAAMADSIRHSATWMGEVDEPPETSRKPQNPLFMAGFFAIDSPLRMARNLINQGCKPKNRDAETISAVLTQMLFAMGMADDALAEYSRYLRTGYIGHPNDIDRERIPTLKNFIRSITRRADEINESFKSGLYDIPLQSPFAYDSEARRHYWTAPIEVPHIPINDE